MDPRRFLGLLAVLAGLVAVVPPAVAQATDPAPPSTASPAESAAAPQPGSGAGEGSVPDVAGEAPSAADRLRAEAGRRFDLGVSYYDDGRYDAALAEFLRTYEITGEWSVLYNLGQVCRALGRNADAVGYFERYLGLGTDEIDADRRAEVFLALDALDPLVGRVRVDIDLDGAHVFVDGIDRGTTPLSRPLLVDPGSHEIEIRDDRLPGARAARDPPGRRPDRV